MTSLLCYFFFCLHLLCCLQASHFKKLVSNTPNLYLTALPVPVTTSRGAGDKKMDLESDGLVLELIWLNLVELELKGGCLGSCSGRQFGGFLDVGISLTDGFGSVLHMIGWTNWNEWCSCMMSGPEFGYWKLCFWPRWLSYVFSLYEELIWQVFDTL